MAEAALLGIAKSVLGQLGAPAFKEILLLWNSDEDLQKLQQTIETITNFLHAAEQRESKEPLVKGWLSRLRAVLYDADDLFDAIAYRVLHKKAKAGNAFKREVQVFFSKSNPQISKVKTTHSVKDIRERIDDIAKDMREFQFAIRPTEVDERRETHSYVNIEDVVGRSGEREEIVKLLLPEGVRGVGKNLSVIAIIGFGGLGKTTLASYVYNDRRVKSGFGICLWACINNHSNLKQLLMAIISSVSDSDFSSSNLERLHRKLRGFIGGKKYLLVLDDVWDEDESNWLGLKPILSCGASGSKVLVTTRKTKVAQRLDSIEPYYHLSVLSEKCAWDLFVKMAFKEGELSSCASDELVLLGKQIIRKCGYVPLAIITVGRMLRYKEKEKSSWLYFVEKELSEVLSDKKGNINIMQVLKLSYKDLTSALKHCFAYCSLFPKDSVYDKDDLVRLWIAQGFIRPHAKKSFEEVGSEYFLELVDRCFFQEVKMFGFEPCLQYKCKMHDLLHDLAIQVAGTECKSIFKEDLVKSSAALRHVSTSCQANFLLDSSGMSSHSKTLRTLLFRDTSAEMNTKSLNSYLASFRMLRVLQLSGLNLNKVPDSVGEMIHLRYIDLSGNSLKVLPNSICELHHLQTLNLRYCYSMEELPSNIGKLVSLRHLLLDGCNRLDPSGLTVLTTLVTLDELKLGHCKGRLEYLGGLDDLSGILEIDFPDKNWATWIEDARNSNMSRKNKLKGMIINLSRLRYQADEEENRTKELLEELKPSQNIQHLKIVTYNADILSSWFSSLSNLRTLDLHECSIEYLDVSCAGSGSSLFPCLKVLKMSDLRYLMGWWRELGNNVPIPVLPRVSRVDVRNCPNLTESMPLLGEEIKELRLIGIKGELVSTPNTSCSSSIYTKMQVLYLSDIEDIKCFPTGWLSQLTGLKSLTIDDRGELSWVYSCGLAGLTSLEKLKLYNSWGTRVQVAEIDNGLEIMQWQGLKRLRVLHMAWQSHLQEGLQYLTSLEELTIEYNEANQVETDNEDMEGRGLAQKLGVMERLHTLHIYNFSHSTCSFPKWIRYLRCLKTLRLEEGSILSLSMSWGILANMSLENLYMDRIINALDISLDDCKALQQTQFHSLVLLEIHNTYSIQVEGSYFPWNFLSSLRILALYDIPDLMRIPDGIQHLTSLQQLMISYCGVIDEIPKWMINLTSLQHLHFFKCSSQALRKRCEPQVGEDWHLISHIPNFIIERRFVDMTQAQSSG